MRALCRPQAAAALRRVAAAAGERAAGPAARRGAPAPRCRSVAAAARVASGGLSSTSGRAPREAPARFFRRAFAAAALEEPSMGVVRLDPDASAPQPFSLVVTAADLAAGGEAAGAAPARLRLDAFLAARIPDVSRARLAEAIRGGEGRAKEGSTKERGAKGAAPPVAAPSPQALDACSIDRWSSISVNGAACRKPSRRVVPGDVVSGSLAPLPPLRVVPESIPLRVAYEDADVAVVSKDPDMVCHPAPGHERGTLVNALLGRWGVGGWEVPGRWEGGGRSGEGAGERGEGGGEGTAGGAGTSARSASGGSGSAASVLAGWEDWDGDLDEAESDEEDGEEAAGIPELGGKGERASPSPVPSASPLHPPPPRRWPDLVRPGIVHRLDRGTSGLLVVARTPSALVLLQRQFRRRAVERRYLAIALGDPTKSVLNRLGKGDLAGLARVAVIVGERGAGENASSPPLQTLLLHSRIARPSGGGSRALRVPPLHSSVGVRAVSELSPLHAFRCGATLTTWKLRTGRTHQIRVHASRVLGTPLVGDELYGGGRDACLHHLRAAATQDPRQLAELGAALETLSRQALHAATLGFDHPRSGARLRFAEAIPGDMALVLRRLAELGGEDWEEVKRGIEGKIGEGMVGEAGEGA